VALQFHAAGIADRFAAGGGLLCAAIAWLYRRCYAGVVMTEFNRRDPEFFGLRNIEVIPHRLPDEFDPALLRKNPDRLRLLYVGHLCPDKGTPELLRAFKTVADREPAVVLELVGETLTPLSDDRLRAEIRELGLEGRVELPGVLTGRAKLEAFGRADLFVFPSVAPYESFGLVMVEAMMWGLPIVATDWRGNRDVLGREFEGICHPVGDDLAASIAHALIAAIQKLRGKSAWTGRNRQLFLDRFSFDAATFDFPERALRWTESHTSVTRD
jgi:glycosyltransferase involved in cell wall biosynthesis